MDPDQYWDARLQEIENVNTLERDYEAMESRGWKLVIKLLRGQYPQTADRLNRLFSA